jgi:pantoate--beta-alanine ligase
MSSRNQYLAAAERPLAPALYTSLSAAARRIAAGDADFASIERAGLTALESAGLRTDYFSIRRTSDLAPPAGNERELVVLTAVRMSKARLIDNIRVTRP